MKKGEEKIYKIMKFLKIFLWFYVYSLFLLFQPADMLMTELNGNMRAWCLKWKHKKEYGKRLKWKLKMFQLASKMIRVEKEEM